MPENRTDARLVVVTRGPYIESAHHGAYCVVRGGKVTRQKGDIESRVFFRSAAKPFQVLTVLESGAADRFRTVVQNVTHLYTDRMYREGVRWFTRWL